MTINEKDKIEALRVLIEDQVLPEIQSIKRGLYGDVTNNTKGLIHVEERVRNIERIRDRILWVGTALIVSFQLAWDYLKAKFFGA